MFLLVQPEHLTHKLSPTHSLMYQLPDLFLREDSSKIDMIL